MQAQEGTKKLLYPLADGLLGWLRGRTNERRAEINVPPALPNLRHWLTRVSAQAVQHGEEIYLFLDVLVESSFLWFTDASLCETYYGMIRRDSREDGLTNMQRLISVLELVWPP